MLSISSKMMIAASLIMMERMMDSVKEEIRMPSAMQTRPNLDKKNKEGGRSNLFLEAKKDR